MPALGIAALLLVVGIISLFVREATRLASLGLFVAAIVAAIASAIVIVPAGHAGVPVLFGKVQNFHLSEGMHLINPLVQVTALSVRTEEYTMSSATREGRIKGDDSIRVLTSDGLEMPLDVTILYRLSPSDAPWIYRNIGPNYEAKIIRPAARTAIREAASNLTAQEAYSLKRKELAEDSQKLLELQIANLLGQHEDFKGPGVIIQDVLLRNVSLPTRVRDAIERKLTAAQEAQQMEFVLEKERKEAERKEIEAKGIANFQKVVSEDISEQLLQWKGIEATMEISRSPNAKVVIIGSGASGLPVILNTN